MVWQTMTGGDGGPSNGRIESEVQQAKRRLRMLVRESGLGERFWPGIARYMWGKERLQSQLQSLGVANEAIASHRVEGHGEDKEVASTWPRTIGNHRSG